MCLTVQSKTILKANEDLVCYKIVEYVNNKPYTPAQAVRIKRNEIIGKTFFRAKPYIGRRFKYDAYDEAYEVGAGFIHTFRDNLKAIFGITEDLAKEHNVCLKVYKCVIPKGTRYVVGEFANTEGYASKCIRFVECVASFSGAKAE